MRLIVIPLVIAVVMLVIGLVLPSRHDKTFAGWWTRVRYQANFFARVALVLAGLGVLLWYVVLPLMGWVPPGPWTR